MGSGLMDSCTFSSALSSGSCTRGARALLGLLWRGRRPFCTDWRAGALLSWGSGSEASGGAGLRLPPKRALRGREGSALVVGGGVLGGGCEGLAAVFLGFLRLPLLGSSFLKGFLVVGASDSGVGGEVVASGVGGGAVTGGVGVVEEVVSWSCFVGVRSLA